MVVGDRRVTFLEVLGEKREVRLNMGALVGRKIAERRSPSRSTSHEGRGDSRRPSEGGGEVRNDMVKGIGVEEGCVSSR